MPATQRRNRKQLRHSIGLLLGAVRHEGGVVESSPSEASQNAAKITDTTLAYGTDNEHRGRWVYATDAGGATHVRRVFASSRDERSITVSKAFPAVPYSTWIYELWDIDVPPGVVHEFINQAISGVTRKGSVEDVDDTFHTGGRINSFALSSNWTGVRDLNWRSGFAGQQIASLDQPLTELTANVSAVADSADFRQGSAAARLDVGAAAAANEALAEAGFTAVDGRGYDRVEFWHKSNGAITSSNLVVQLRQGSSTHESIPVPATLATQSGQWRYASMALTAPERNNAINAVRVAAGSSDGGAITAWLDDVKLVRSNSEVWHRVPREFWRVGAASRQFTLTDDARLRVTGVRAPTLLDSDSQICEVDTQYVINSTAAGVMRSRSDRRGAIRDAAMQQADLYEQIAQTQRLRMNTPANIRWVDD
ncbi:MAG: hypothetical protein O3C69_01155 [Chloroflexi bacterium]|nr:hypothetical protein [Chloroflexota bacterium]